MTSKFDEIKERAEVIAAIPKTATSEETRLAQNNLLLLRALELVCTWPADYDSRDFENPNYWLDKAAGVENETE